MLGFFLELGLRSKTLYFCRNTKSTLEVMWEQKICTQGKQLEGWYNSNTVDVERKRSELILLWHDRFMISVHVQFRFGKKMELKKHTEKSVNHKHC